jgi:hypothetical protein
MEKEIEKGFCDRSMKTKCRKYGGMSFWQKASGLLTTWNTKNTTAITNIEHLDTGVLTFKPSKRHRIEK